MGFSMKVRWLPLFLAGILSLVTTSTLDDRRSKHKLFRFPINSFSNSPFIGRHVTLDPSEGVTRAACMRKCSRDTSCSAVVTQLLADGRVSCVHLFRRAPNQGATLKMCPSKKTQTKTEVLCKHGGQMENGICLCPKEYTGEFCERMNSRVCNGNWKKILSFNKTTFGKKNQNSTLLTSAPGLPTKVLTRHDVSAFWRVTEIMSHHMKGKLVSYIHLLKASMDTYQVNASRNIIEYSTRGNSAAISFNDRRRDYNITSLDVQNVEFWCLEESPFTETFKLAAHKLEAMKERLRSGKTIFLSNSVHVLKNNIFISDTEKQIVMLRNYTSVYWWMSRFSFSLSKSITRPYLGSNGEIPFLTNEKLSAPPEWHMNPCWFVVQKSRKNLMNLRHKLNAYLNTGKAVRVLVDQTYADVHESIREGEESYAILAPMTTYPGAKPFDKSERGMRSLVSAGGVQRNCVHIFESETIVDMETKIDVKVDWFVDSRDWKELYSVFTNSTVAKGELSELRDAVKNAKTVRLRLAWLHKPRVRYMATTSSSVSDTGKVSTETLTTWRLVYTYSPTLIIHPRCDQEMLLVNTEGRIEVAHFNIFTPAVSEVLTEDILVSWFIN